MHFEMSSLSDFGLPFSVKVLYLAGTFCTFCHELRMHKGKGSIPHSIFVFDLYF